MHIPAMNTNVPGNAMKFFSTLMPIVMFDILSEWDLYEETLLKISRLSIDDE